MPRLKLNKTVGDGTESHTQMQKIEVKDALRQLLATLEPLIRSSGSSTHLHGMLTYLEEADETAFQHLKLAQWVQRQLTTSIRSMVMTEISAQCQDSELTPHKMKMVAPAILHKIMQSMEIRQCLGEMRKLLQAVGVEMKANFDQEFAKVILMVDEASLDALGQDFCRPSMNQSVSSQDSLFSTWHQSNFIFLQPQEYNRLGEKLNRFSPTDVKIEALNTLLLTQLSEIVSTESWPFVKEGLQSSLMDSSSNVSFLSLKIHHRLMSNITPLATREAFTSVMSSIGGIYRDRNRIQSLPSMTSGISSKKRFHQSFLQVFKLVAHFCTELPKYWLRYPERLVHDMVEHLFQAITSPSNHHMGKKAPIHPMMILAVVDPQAKWLTAWFHSSMGRTLSLKYMDVGFIRYVTDTVLDVLENYNLEEWSLIRNALARKSAITKKALSEAVIRYANLIHCVNIVVLLSKTRRGSEKSTKIDQCISRMIMFVSVSNHIALKGPSKWIIHSLESLAGSKDSAHNFVTTMSLERILSPMRSYIQDFDSQPRKSLYFSLEGMVRIVTVLINNATIKIDPDPALPSSGLDNGITMSILETCAKFSALTFKAYASHDAKLLASVARLALAIGTNHLGCLVSSFEPMIQSLSACWCALRDTTATPTNSLLNLKHYLDEDEPALTEEMKTVLQKLCQTPRGFFTIFKHVSVQDLYGNELHTIAENENLSLLAVSAPGVRILCNTRFLEQRLAYILDTISLEGDNKHWRPSQMETEDRLLRATVLFVQLLSSFEFLKINVPIPIESNPKNDVKAMLLLNSKIFNHYSESESVFALKMFSCVASGLDNFLYLERNFQMLERIDGNLYDEDKAIGDSGEMIIDRETLYLHFLSHSLRSIGGHGERPMPKLSFEERADWKSCVDVPEPDFQPRKGSRAAESLLQFLAITKSQYHDREWLEQAKKMFGTSITTSMVEVKEKLLTEILDQMQESWQVIPNEDLPSSHTDLSISIESTLEALKLPLDFVVNYGCSIDLIDQAKRDTHLEQLADVLTKAPNTFLTERFDWFIGVSFLMMSGTEDGDGVPMELEAKDKCLAFLRKISRSYMSVFLWPNKTRAFCRNRHETKKLKFACDIELFVSLFGHHIEAILSKEAPVVFMELQNEMISPSLLCYQWWNQCLLNVLDWTEICHYHLLIILFGPDYLIYFFTALLRHLQTPILEAVQDQHGDGRYLIEILMTEPVSGFRTGDYLPFMQLLAKTYSKLILKDFKTFLNM
ncbi:protein broad-minded-like [Tigriopus californicus]|uniref:protein broad-minded-like n=1 Tax=Tigriopus californicus TaxID=6832 RepID=UPI0027DAB3E0|nr:protein broad-minded-like [Tigriopus californicus]